MTRQNVVRSGETVFILTQNDCLNSSDLAQAQQCSIDRNEFPFLTCCKSSKDHARDTVFNVCLEVGDVEKVTESVRKQGKTSQPILKETTVMGEMKKPSKCSVVQSPCGNVVHTLIETQVREGQPFLPGFKPVPLAKPGDKLVEGGALITSLIDHVTYVCRSGETREILDWYSACFGMKRFLVNPTEDLETGVEIGGEVGMRMTVGEWISSWMCREEGVEFVKQTTADERRRNFKLVLAEPLPGREDSHVQNFIRNHGGPGLQHIGLAVSGGGEDSSGKVERVVADMAARGAQFRRPPPTYYQLPEKEEEIVQAGGSTEVYSDLGLLLDAEADFNGDCARSDASDNGKYLIQIFTKPLFGPDEDTFFLEVLERRGARGFGAGNITALAKSIILFNAEKAKLCIPGSEGHER